MRRRRSSSSLRTCRRAWKSRRTSRLRQTGRSGANDAAMFEIKQKEKQTERALLIGAYTDASKKAEAQNLLEELEDLVDTLGIPIVERRLVHHRENHARYLLGSGKAQELVDFAKE